MRFVELRPSPDGGSFHLHHRITWLKGLAPAARVAVVGMVHDVALGERPDWGGVLDIDGEHVDLAEGIERIGETGDAALVIDAASLPDVTADDLALDDSDLDGAGLESAKQKLQELEERITSLAEELAASSKVRSDMTAHLTSSLAQVETTAADLLDGADGELGRAARLAQRPDPWTGMSGVPERMAELTDQITAVDERLSTLPSGDRPALAAAVAIARASLVTGAVPSPEAVALAQAWSSLHQRLRGLESRMEAAGGGTEAVAERLEVARKAARIAEDAAVPRQISAEETDKLEILHEARLNAEQKAGRSVRRGVNRAAFDEAEQNLQDALEPLGYPTWAAFRMGNGLASVPTEVLAEHERTQTELEAAELEWAMLMARIESDTELQDVLSALDKALEHATEILGSNPTKDDAGSAETVVMEALQGVTVEASTIGVDREAGIAHLREALTAAGAGGHETLTSDAAIVALGDSWTNVLMAADELAIRLLRDRERATEELDALEGLGDGSRVDRLDPERAAVREAEKAVARTRDALGNVVDARMQLHMLAATELNLAEEHDDRLVQRESAQVLLDLAVRRTEGRTNTDAAVALAERVPRGTAGPVPVVVVMGDSPAKTLDRLVAVPDDVQILIIGEGQGMREWLDEVGADVAGQADAGTLV